MRWLVLFIQLSDLDSLVKATIVYSLAFVPLVPCTFIELTTPCHDFAVPGASRPTGLEPLSLCVHSSRGCAGCVSESGDFI
jgi:hypothetical protein